jgi:NodT family efflux transporter outer membrane factor (OMF) lipoprotein
LATALSLAACAVGPEFQQPKMALPAQYAHHASSDPIAGTVLPDAADTEFWRSFEDPQLSALVSLALDANKDLRASLARYDSANALLRQAKFDYIPTITASALGGHQEVSKAFSYGYPRNYYDYSVGANASWELDLFGRVRRSVEAQRAQTAASAEDLAALQVAVVGEAAGTYIQLRGLQERLRITHQNVVNQNETLRLVEARLAAGRGTTFDTARERAQWETTGSQVPALEAQIAVAEHRLAVLTGRPPEALIFELDPAKPLPAVPAQIDAGTPADLLRRRPDIAAAEARLHAATAQVGVATADLFPRLSLVGALGTMAIQTGGLFEGSSRTSLAALGIDWSFLDVGRVRARIAASQADATGRLAQYQQTVLLALEDTENALVRYAKTRDEDEQLERAAHDSEQAAALASTRYRAGAIGLYEVLDAEHNVLIAQYAFVDSRMRSAMAAVALYQALAGGWPQHELMRRTSKATKE